MLMALSLILSGPLAALALAMAALCRVVPGNSRARAFKDMLGSWEVGLMGDDDVTQPTHSPTKSLNQ
jgi:hypothetical protein